MRKVGAIVGTVAVLVGNAEQKIAAYVEKLGDFDYRRGSRFCFGKLPFGDRRLTLTEFCGKLLLAQASLYAKFFQRFIKTHMNNIIKVKSDNT